jgi:nitroreductase
MKYTEDEMDFLNLARKRYSVRAYTNQKVGKEKLEAILEAGRVAPTGCNKQPQHILVIESEAGMEKLQKAANTYGAPVVLVVCMEKGGSWTRPYDGKNLMDIDAAIVTDHMMLEAASLGLGSCWICNFKPDELRKAFSIPGNLEPVNILLVGYADTIREEAKSPERHDRTRKRKLDIVEYV